MDRNIFLEALKAFLGIDPSDTSEDAQLLLYIDQAIEACEDYLGRKLDQDTFDEIVFDVGRDLVLRNWPIVDLLAITGTEGTEYPVDNYIWSVNRNVVSVASCSSGHNLPCNVVVQYVAGYLDDDIPQWLMSSVNLIAAALYNLAGTGKSVTTGGSGETKKFSIPGVYSVEYDVGTTSSEDDLGGGSFGVIPAAARQTLDFYRDKRLG